MKKQSISRRDFIRVASMVAGGLVIASCSQKAAETPGSIEEDIKPTAPPKENIELELFETDESGAGAEGLKAYEDLLVKPYMEANPHVKVKLTPAIDDWFTTILTRIAAGQGPDIFVNYAGLARPLMENGELLDITSYLPAEDEKDFYEQQMIAMKLDGKLYAMPKYVSSISMAYNKDILDKAQVPYPDGTWSWDDFLFAIEKISKLGSGESGKIFGYYVITDYQFTWVWQNGGDWMDKPVLGTKILIDQPKAMEALAFQHDLRFKYHYAPTVQEIEGMGWWQAMLSERFAFIEGHSWQVSEWIRSGIKFDYTAMPCPAPVSDDKRIATIFNDARAIWKGTKQPDEAAKYLLWLSSPEVMKTMMLSLHGWQPSRKSLIPAWNTESAGAKAGYNVKAFSDSALRSRQAPYFMNNQKVSEIFDPIWEQIWGTAEKELEPGVKEICEEVNSFLSSS